MPSAALPDTLMVAGSLAAIAGVGALRLAWQRDRRSAPLNLAGWLLLAAGAALGWAGAGMWGSAVASLFAMLAAFVLLALAGLRSPPGKARASNRRVGALPERGEPLRLAGRCLTFVLVALAAALLGGGIAVAVGWVTLLSGAGKADAYATAMFVAPLAWSALAFAVLMQRSRRRQFGLLAIASVPSWPLLAAGVLS